MMNTRWKSGRALCAALAASSFILVSCGDDGPTSVDPIPEPPPPPPPGSVSEEIGSDGGSLVSSDGNLTVTVPAGALSGTETITIRQIEAEDLGSEFDPLLGALGDDLYELEPDGLEFAAPVTVRYQTAQTPETTGDSLGVLAEFLFSSSDGGLEVLDGVRTSLDADEGTVTVEGTLSHFSPLATSQANNGVSFFVFGVPESLPVGATFTADAQVFESEAGPLSDLVTLLGPAGYEDQSEAPIAPTFSPLESELEGTPDEGFGGMFVYACADPGTGVYQTEMTVRVRFDLDSGPIEAESFAPFLTTVSCEEPAPTEVVVEVTLEGDGSGSVSSEPAGIDCPDACEASFDENATVLLNATPDEGSVFVGWSGEAPADCADEAICEIQATEEMNEITATFEAEPPPPPSGDVIPAGVTGPERMSLVPRVWGDMEMPTEELFLLAIPGEDGVAIVDVGTGEVLEFFPNPPNVSSEFAAFGVEALLPVTDVNGFARKWLLMYGTTGWYLQGVNLFNGQLETGQVRPTDGTFQGTTTAAKPPGSMEDIESGAMNVVVVEAEAGRIVVEKPDPLRAGAYDGFAANGSDDILLNASEGDFPEITSAPLTAWRGSDDGDVPDLIVVTQGLGDQEPGQVYHSTFFFGRYQTAELEGQAGFDVRSMECKDNPAPDPDEARSMCFAFNFASDSWTPILLFEDGEVDVLSEVPVGDGPVTGDSRVTSSGKMEVISTGFNSGDLYLGRFDFTGDQFSGASVSLPGECVNPGAARFWPPDPGVAYVSCSGSDVVVRVDLPMLP